MGCTHGRLFGLLVQLHLKVPVRTSSLNWHPFPNEVQFKGSFLSSLEFGTDRAMMVAANMIGMATWRRIVEGCVKGVFTTELFNNFNGTQYVLISDLSFQEGGVWTNP